MDLCNPTGDTIKTMFDSVPYIFKPRSVMTLPDEAGRHVAALWGKYGIVEVHFGDDADKIRYTGLLARCTYYRGVLEGHDLVNERQKEMKFPPIVDSDAVKQAKVAYPIYQKALGKIEERLGTDAAAAYAADLVALLEEQAPKLPLIKDATLTQLRDEATRLGITWQPAWNYLELREAIESTKAVAAMAPVTVGEPAASGINVVPGPEPGVLPETLANAPFNQI